MIDVVEMILVDNFPELSGHPPFATAPLLLDVLAVPVSTDALVSAPSPAWLPILVVSLPQFPEPTLNTPMTLDVAFDDAPSVPIVSDTFVRAP